MLVVDDLLADVDGRAVDLQRAFDGDHRAVHPGAVPPGVGQEDTSTLLSHDTHCKCLCGRSRACASGTGHGTSGWNWTHRGVGVHVVGQGGPMAREIPEVVRAAAGLAATVLDEARKLPETLPGLPVRLIGLAMQSAMKVQQQYAGFVARGDELFTGGRGGNEPGLATFDDDDEPEATGFRESAFDRASDAAPTADLITDDEVADDAPGTDEILDEIAIDELVDQAPTLEETAPTPAPAKAARKAAKKATQPAATVEASTDASTSVDAEPTADVATTVDVLTAEGDVATVDAAVTDEGVAAPESPQDAEPAPPAAAPASRSD